MKVRTHHTLVLAVLLAASVFVAGHPTTCLGQSVIIGVEKAIAPDYGTMIDLGKQKSTKPAISPFVEAVIRDITQERHPGILNPKGPSTMPGASVPSHPGPGSSAVPRPTPGKKPGPSHPGGNHPSHGPNNVDWPGVAGNILGGLLSRPSHRRPSESHCQNQHGYPPANQGSSTRPPRNVLPGNSTGTSQHSLILTNPVSTKTTVQYVFNGQTNALRPGHTHNLGCGEGSIIKFDRGGSQGFATYRMSDGMFEFTLTSKGWDLVEKKFEITIDNQGNAQPFYYIANGQNATVGAGRENTHTSGQPIVIAFDRGDGGKPAQRSLENGRYAVAVNPQTSLLDLMPVVTTTPGVYPYNNTSTIAGHNKD